MTNRLPNPFFSKVTISGGEPRTLPPCSCLRVYSITGGTLALTFSKGDPIPADAGHEFHTESPHLFDEVVCEVTAGGSAIVIFGLGYTSNAAGGGLLAE